MRLITITFLLCLMMFSQGRASPKKEGQISIFLRADVGFLKVYPEKSLLIINQWSGDPDYELKTEGYSMGGMFGIEPIIHIHKRFGIGFPIIIHSFDTFVEEGKLNNELVHTVIYRRSNLLFGISFLIINRLHVATYFNKYSLHQKDYDQKKKLFSANSQIWEFTYYYWEPKIRHEQPEPCAGLMMRIEESDNLTFFGFFLRVNFPLHLLFPEIDLW